MSLSVTTLQQALLIAEKIQQLEAELAGLLKGLPAASKSIATVVAAASAPKRKKRKAEKAGKKG